MKGRQRKIVAVGDLHGDFYRLVRILSHEDLLDRNTLDWTPEASSGDVVLLGDYVDWRGEPLEGPAAEWPQGPARIVNFIYRLHQSNQRFKREGSEGNFYPLLGNHDAMMLEGHAILEQWARREPGLLSRFQHADSLLDFISASGLSPEEENGLLKFLNWYQQGGANTIESFGGLHPWFSAVGGELGDFLRKLPLAVVVNDKLFCHSVPDSREFWVPIYEKRDVPPERYEKVREQFLWGRKVWGYDAFAGGPTSPLTEEEVDEMLNQLKVKAVVVGHTPLHRDRPYFHYGGKIINIDSHGIPGSQAFSEVYELPALRKRPDGPLKRKKMKAWKRFGRG